MIRALRAVSAGCLRRQFTIARRFSGWPGPMIDGALASNPTREFRICAGLAAVVILVHSALLLFSGWAHSPNPLEVNLLPAGYMHLKYGQFDIAQVNPPFSRTLMAVPLLWMNIEEDWRAVSGEPGSRSAYTVGAMFVDANRESVQVIFALARGVGAIFSIMGACVIFKIAHDLYGSRGALAAVIAWCFCPLILGHGATVNHDVPGAAMLVVACFSFLRLWRTGSSQAATLCGIASGIAVLTRTTNIAFVGLWLFISTLPLSKETGSLSWPRRTGHALIVLALTLLLLNLGYEFQGAFTPLGEYEFVSSSLNGSLTGEIGNRFRGTIIEYLPVPLPKDFVIGIDLQQRDFESPSFSSYLFGEWRSRGWWYYYLVGWLIKTPIGFQVLFLLATIGFLWDCCRRQVQFEECLVVSTIVLMFVLAAFKSGFTIHYRYIIPASPFIAILCGRIWRRDSPWSHRQNFGSAMIAYGVLSSLLVFPHSMSYFNEFAGGPSNGGQYLSHSSSDWGQDLYALREWLAKQRRIGRDIYADFYGPLISRNARMACQRIPSRKSVSGRRGEDEDEIKPGLYAISVGRLYSEDGTKRYLARFQPCHQIGYSIKIYDLTQAEIDSCHLNRAPQW